ncbi:MAG: DNA topoisomerase VI subunit B [Candidatus Aenigmarchaeota archaeon]|nr:DNA topoisomerase VI subunit B [Candidatus Aenigmarchaeota archaeon]
MDEGRMSTIAEELSKELKAISVSEFFERNRHLLGYDNPTKALLTIVKEGVDNSLDACEEARILPKIWVEIRQKDATRFKIMMKDNGPGVPDKKIPYVFGKLLYGSRFHRLLQTRGQQGLGIKGCVLYAQLTTGKPTTVISSTGDGKTSYYEIMINVARNEPEIIKHEIINDGKVWHGLKIEMEVEGRYVEGPRSVLEYLRQSAIMNPHAHIIFRGPNGKVEFPRAINQLPPKPREIKPHPHGVELGVLKRMLEFTRSKTLLGFLMNEFSRVGKDSAMKVLKKAGLDANRDPRSLELREVEKLFKAMQLVDFVRPPTDCLSPVGEKALLEGMKKELPAEFFAAVTRKPEVYRGMPFQVEVGVAYGGNLPNEAKLMRFANRVPLLYQAGDCAITKAVIATDWTRYGLKQNAKSMPEGPIVILVHFASVWVPFISEGKQAIASYPIIMKEIKLGLQEVGRRLARYLAGKRRIELKRRKIQIFERYIPEVARALAELTEVKQEIIEKKLKEIGIKKVGDVGEEFIHELSQHEGVEGEKNE